MAVASTSVFWTAFSFVMTTTEVYREFRDPAMTVHRSMEASSNHILHEIASAPYFLCPGTNFPSSISVDEEVYSTEIDRFIPIDIDTKHTTSTEYLHY